jgi:plasmid stability protein
MSALVVRNVDRALVAALQIRAIKNNRSPSQEAIAILASVLKEKKTG